MNESCHAYVHAASTYVSVCVCVYSPLYDARMCVCVSVCVCVCERIMREGMHFQSYSPLRRGFVVFDRYSSG